MTERRTTIATLYRPQSVTAAWIVDISLIMGGAALTALSAQVVIHLNFTPVPITGQTFAVLLAGAALGSVRGALSQLVYVFAGIAGLHVFAGGAHGWSVVVGVTGGYILGFVLAALVVGWLAERGWDRRPLSAAGMLLVGNLAIYAVGLPWLYLSVGADLCAHPFFGQYIPRLACGNPVALTLYAGLFPFVVGDAIKLLLASSLLPSAWQLVGRLTGARKAR